MKIYSDFEIFESLISLLENDYLKKDYVPVSAFILNENRDKIIFTTNEFSNLNKIAHAEIKAIEKCYQENFNLKNSILYLNLEPCLMCLAATSISGISKIIYLTNCDKWGSVNDLQSGFLKIKNGKSLPFCEKYNGNNSENFAKRSEEILKNFFIKKRN